MYTLILQSTINTQTGGKKRVSMGQKKRKHGWSKGNATESILDDNSYSDEDNDYLVYFIAIYVNDYLFLFSPEQIKKNMAGHSFVLVPIALRTDRLTEISMRLSLASLLHSLWAFSLCALHKLYLVDWVQRYELTHIIGHQLPFYIIHLAASDVTDFFLLLISAYFYYDHLFNRASHFPSLHFIRILIFLI